MGHCFYTRSNLFVETYDAGCPELGDVGFYLEQARRTGGPVLELACGTGRVVWALAEEGFEVVGLDISEPMLRLAEAKGRSQPAEVAGRVFFRQGDMARFELLERFRFVFSAFRGFQALTTPEEQHTCLDCCYRHLQPGGLLVLDLFDPQLDRCVDGEVEEPVPAQDLRHPESGNPVRAEILWRRNDAVRQVLHERWRLTEADAQGRPVRVEEEELELRWTYRWEMRHLLELCGFEVEAEYSDFDGSPPAYGKEQIWVARRP